MNVSYVIFCIPKFSSMRRLSGSLIDPLMIRHPDTDIRLLQLTDANRMGQQWVKRRDVSVFIQEIGITIKRLSDTV